MEEHLIVLDTAATNGVFPYEHLLINIRESKNSMICGGNHVMKSNKMRDLVITGKTRNFKDIKMRINNVYIEPKSPYTIIISTKATKYAGFEIIQRGHAMALVNEKGDHILFDITYHTRMGYLICKDIKESIKINGTEHNNTKKMRKRTPRRKWISTKHINCSIMHHGIQPN